MRLGEPENDFRLRGGGESWYTVRQMRPLATDTHDFPALRRAGKIYVDKTEYIYRLIAHNDTRLYFMSRPRRFGKSLTVSALKALFFGRRELFKGLYLDGTDWKWEKRRLVDCAAEKGG